MMKKTGIALLLLFGLNPVYAGWYACYNYKGTIDRYPVTFSIQFIEGYFGRKKAYNVVGIYQYDRHNTPIRLAGTIKHSTGKVILYEMQGDKETATLEFELSAKAAKGSWTDRVTKKALSLQLNLVSQLTDTSEANTFEGLEVLQGNSLPEYYFIGVYSRPNNESRAQMDRLKIVQKKDNAVFQVIDFSKVETTTGNVMTIIYDNVEVVNKKTKKLHVWNNIGRVGGYLTLTYDIKQGRFKLNPEPTVDGPD